MSARSQQLTRLIKGGLRRNTFPPPGVPFHIWAAPVVDRNRCTALGKKKKKTRTELCRANPAEVFWLLQRTTKTATRILISSFWKLSPTIRPSTTQPPRPAFHWPHAGPRNHVINSLICHLRIGHDGSPSAAHLLLCGKTPGAALSIYPITKYPRSAN